MANYTDDGQHIGACMVWVCYLIWLVRTIATADRYRAFRAVVSFGNLRRRLFSVRECR